MKRLIVLFSLFAGLAAANDAAYNFARSPWTYGWRDGADFAPMVHRDANTCGTDNHGNLLTLDCWSPAQSWFYTLPQVAINNSGAEFFATNEGGSLTDYDLGAVYLRPSWLNPIVRWTAPSDGCWRLAGSAAAADRINIGASLHILKDGALSQTKKIAGYSLVHLRIQDTFTAGQTVDFEVEAQNYNSVVALRLAASTCYP